MIYLRRRKAFKGILCIYPKYRGSDLKHLKLHTMYSGDKVFYAVPVSLEQAYKILLAYAKKQNIELRNDVELYGDEYYINEFESYKELYEQFNVLECVILELNFKFINVFRPSCCSFNEYNSLIYIGAKLGSNDVAYRDNTRIHNDFEEYYNSYIKGVCEMKEKLEENKVFIDAEIRQLVVDCTPKIYTMANDCENCT